jgi:hypothetical protein
MWNNIFKGVDTEIAKTIYASKNTSKQSKDNENKKGVLVY